MKCLEDEINVATKSFCRYFFEQGRWVRYVLTIFFPDGDDDKKPKAPGGTGGPDVGIPLQPRRSGAVATVISLDDNNEQTELATLNSSQIEWARSEARDIGHSLEKVIIPPVISDWGKPEI